MSPRFFTPTLLLRKSDPELTGLVAQATRVVSQFGRRVGRSGPYRHEFRPMAQKIFSQAWRLILAGLLLAAVTYASYKRGVPASGLPGAALGWTFLFHIERASIVLATAGIVLLVAWRALHGEFPIKFGNVEYAAKDAAAEARQVSASQERRIRYLEVLAGIRPPADIEDNN